METERVAVLRDAAQARLVRMTVAIKRDDGVEAISLE
jgi:hypothetical protein